MFFYVVCVTQYRRDDKNDDETLVKYTQNCDFHDHQVRARRSQILPECKIGVYF